MCSCRVVCTRNSTVRVETGPSRWDGRATRPHMTNAKPLELELRMQLDLAFARGATADFGHLYTIKHS